MYSNILGEKLYTTTAPFLGLPSARQAQRIRAKETADKIFLPGLNQWAIDFAASRECRPLQNGMDGTRVIRIVELYQNRYLVGKAFPSDVRHWPESNSLDCAVDWHQVQDYVLNVRLHNLYAPEAFSFNLSDTSGKLSDTLIGSIPEPQSGVTAECIFSMMMKVELMANTCHLPLVGHCTDSASNCLKALVLLASPKTYSNAGVSVDFLSLSRKDFIFKAPILRSFPSIAYPCWDHSGRTSLRNLMNQNISSNKHGMQEYSVATIDDLKRLKQLHPSSTVRYADITPKVKQNCDATALQKML